MPLDNVPMIARDAAKAIKAGTSDEPLVSASNSLDWICRPAYFNLGFKDALPEIWVRETVMLRLKTASRALPEGYQLVLLDGWRPKHVQQALLDDMRRQVALTHPDLPDDQIDDLTLLYCSKVSDDPVQPSPHLTGGSVDVTLADADGIELDMGSGFDEPSERSWTAHELDGVPAQNRAILYEAMTQAGFTNLPSEWWHYDYGNWIWAWYSNKPAAIYGPIEHDDLHR